MKKKHVFKIILSIVVIAVSFIWGMYLIKLGYSNYTIEKLDIHEKSNVDYKVYLKENNFFETPYLEKDNIYITSLIDYIDVNFDYTLKMDELRTGNYNYRIKAIMSADTQDNAGSYWKKEYTLLDEKIIPFYNQNNLVINENVKIDYQSYNDALLEFKKQFNLAINGELKVGLYVDTTILGTTESINNEAVCSLSIPLTKATIEVPISIEAPTNERQIKTAPKYSNDIKYLIFKILGFALIAVGTINILVISLGLVKHGEKEFNYSKVLKKILKTYDGIIVNSETMPSVDNLNLIKVSTFEELLDAHSELRLPIVYYNSKKGAVFTLINGDIAWQYILEKR